MTEMNANELTQPTPEQVAEYYAQWTDHYIRDFGEIFQAMQTRNPVDFIEYIGKRIHLADGMRVLDAGCGIGGPAAILASLWNVEITGMNISRHQLNYGRKMLNSRQLRGKVTLQYGDFHLLDEIFPENHFDRILFLESLVHSANPERVIRACRKVLKTGGILYIKDLFEGPRHPENPGLTRFPMSQINRLFMLQIKPVGDILNLLVQNGFEIRICQRPEIEADFDRGNRFTARHLFQLLPEQKGPWHHDGLKFLHWLEIVARRVY